MIIWSKQNLHLLKILPKKISRNDPDLAINNLWLNKQRQID